MTFKDNGSNSSSCSNGSKLCTTRRILPYVFFSMVLIVFSLLSLVVTMLVTGSLHVINTRFIHYEKIDIVTIMVAAIIIMATVVFFIRNVKKIFRFIEEQIRYRT